MEERNKGVALALFGMFIYGLEPIVIKANPSNPVSFAFFSALFAAIFLAFYPGAVREAANGIRKGFFVGLFGTALAYISYSYGAKLSTATNAALITRAEVLFSFLLAGMLLRERITGARLINALIVLTGVVLVLTHGAAVKPGVGDVLLLLVPLFWQLGHVIAKTMDISPQSIALLRNSFGALLLFPAALLTGLEFTPYAVLEGLIIALGQVVWYASIRRIELSLATAIITPAPVVAIGMSLLLGESVTFWHLAGFVLITLGTLGLIRSS
ncbi:DMT family transporter [Pyrococcus yayanosii]|uniref:EamA domain-containing protein n=1 Tax=Pyrococcus yayanosii (strain CH1 / JCM 16557) TaxID=529709 RepID=F8AH04_PYRYC|nr:DMT family transporter [Pyrococcus yayanosii]AEH24062.1 hypothetical protein PYCH_03710 [Pyrococcus yayanosii CH1]